MRDVPRLRWIAAVFLVAAALAAQAQKGARAAGPALTDAELDRAIRERFARSKISANHFTVRVQGGVATLDGQTDVIQHKAVATRLARNAGARQVVNRIQVSERAKQKASANLAKGRRRAQIKRSETSRRSDRAR